MRFLSAFVLLTGMGTHSGLFAQSDFYDTGAVQEIRIYFVQPVWDNILDSLFIAGDKERLHGDVTINGTFLPDVGVRYKGFSSFSSARVKNPFNIKLNYIHVGQDYQGYDKIKLSNVIQDPSFVRETLSYEIARNYMPASLANFANVYVNDTLIGLYTNVEAVNNEFTEKHFNDRNNPFFKCNPVSLDLNGENANLSDTPGTDSTQYVDLYSLESEYGWGSLLELIDTLNNAPHDIHEVLNVDRALWMHAFNYSLVNFDSYVGYAQNYYLFRDKNERWNTILWDLNMSFGSFRFTDASTYWNGFSIQQAFEIDPLSHFNSVSVLPRPLLRNLFGNETYRKMYMAHIRTIVQENFLNQSYYARAFAMQNLIAVDVLADTNKFYSNQDFIQNLDSTVNDIIDYPGIAELCDQRADYLSNYRGFNGEPNISGIVVEPQTVVIGNDVFILANINDVDSAFIAYRFDENDLFNYAEMKDDGLIDNGIASDGVYGARVVAESNLLQYYMYAENDSAGVFSPARAAYEFHSFVSPIASGDLVVNEFMAYNEGDIQDENGESDDWIELFNASAYPISTAGLYLSDESTNKQKWALPQVLVNSNEYLIIWADDQEGQGENHAGFKLDATGESLFLAYSDTLVIDSVRFQTQYPISSMGRYPNGTGAFMEMFPTFNGKNSINSNGELDRYIHIYPNPSNGNVYAIIDESSPFELQVLTLDGRAVTAPYSRVSNDLVILQTYGLAAGAYSLRITTSTSSTQQTFTLTE